MVVSKAARLARAVPLTLANVPPAKATVGVTATVSAGMAALGFQPSVAPAPVAASAPR